MMKRYHIYKTSLHKLWMSICGREVILLKSTLSESMFNQFTSSYQAYTGKTPTDNPFVYVDTEGNVKLLTNVVEDDGNVEGIFAVSVAEDGWMEFLALQE